MSAYKKLLTLVSKRPKKTVERVKKQELKLIPYNPIILSTEDRFKSSYSIEGICWEWQGSLDRYGYGKFRIGKSTVKAHRYSYELFNGAFDKKLHVLHTCDNPKCVNPQHLFLGTNQDNVNDRVNKNRTKTGTKKLSVEAKKSMLKLLETQSKKVVAELFGVHVSTVSRVKAKGSQNVL